MVHKVSPDIPQPVLMDGEYRIPIMLLFEEGIKVDCCPLQSLWKDAPVDAAAEDEDEEDADFTVDLDQMLADADAAAAQTQARRS